jgi:hypothetical protein
MYVQRNMRVSSYNHCCSVKATSITQPVCVFVALGIQHAICMLYIVIYGLPRSTTFFQITSQTERFSGGKNVTEHKSVFRVSLNFLSATFFSF